jgi:hypothetical protein
MNRRDKMTNLNGTNFTLHKDNHNVIPDDRDYEIAGNRLAAWDERTGPRVGDFVIMPDGTTERFSHDWGEDIQTCFHGSFHLGDGYASMSGSLNAAIPKDKIIDTGFKAPGRFWFFHHDYWTAHHGVGLVADCRVYQYIPERG